MDKKLSRGKFLNPSMDDLPPTDSAYIAHASNVQSYLIDLMIEGAGLKEAKMPTYEYECTSCEHHWEAEQSIKDAPLTECPKCAEQTAKRLIAGSSFTLNGNCWSRDGYR